MNDEMSGQFILGMIVGIIAGAGTWAFLYYALPLPRFLRNGLSFLVVILMMAWVIN